MRAFFRWAEHNDVNPTDLLLRRNLKNQIALDEGWALFTGDASFPNLEWPLSG